MVYTTINKLVTVSLKPNQLMLDRPNSIPNLMIQRSITRFTSQNIATNQKYKHKLINIFQ